MDMKRILNWSDQQTLNQAQDKHKGHSTLDSYDAFDQVCKQWKHNVPNG